MRALADPTRRLIVEELADRNDQTLYEICVRMIMNHGVHMTRQAIAKHLGILEKASLVRTRRRGKFKVLTLDERPIRQLQTDWIDGLGKRGQPRR